MVNKQVITLANNSFFDNQDAIAEMRVAMDNLCRHNQTLKDNILHLR